MLIEKSHYKRNNFWSEIKMVFLICGYPLITDNFCFLFSAIQANRESILTEAQGLVDGQEDKKYVFIYIL